MTRIFSFTLAALLAIAIQAGTANEARAGKTARNIAIGVGVGLAAIAVTAAAARAEERRRRHQDRCEYFNDRCAGGARWACRKFDRHCDGE